MIRYFVYNLSTLPNSVAQSFLKEMQNNGYKCYDYVVLNKIWYAIFDVDAKVFRYVVEEGYYYSLTDATKRLEELVRGCETIMLTPDVRYQL